MSPAEYKRWAEGWEDYVDSYVLTPAEQIEFRCVPRAELRSWVAVLLWIRALPETV